MIHTNTILVTENSIELDPERNKLRKVLGCILVVAICVGAIVILKIMLPFDFLWRDNPPLISVAVAPIALGAVFLAVKLKLI